MTTDTVTIGGEKYHWVGGQWVQSDPLRIAEQIQEFDPNLKVQYLEEAASVGDPPFRVVEMCRDGIERTALYAWALDARVLERLRMADTAIRNVEAELEASNEKVRQAENQRYQEQVLEAGEIAKAVLKSDKESYTVKDGERLVVIHHSRPAEVKS